MLQVWLVEANLAGITKKPLLYWRLIKINAVPDRRIVLRLLFSTELRVRVRGAWRRQPPRQGWHHFPHFYIYLEHWHQHQSRKWTTQKYQAIAFKVLCLSSNCFLSLFSSLWQFIQCSPRVVEPGDSSLGKLENLEQEPSTSNSSLGK